MLMLLMAGASVYAFLTKDLFLGKSLIVGAVFTLPPAIYLGIRKKKNWKKVFYAVLLFGLAFGLVFAFVAELTLSWEVLSTIVPVKLFGIHTIDTTMGIMLMTLLTIVFYQHFIEPDSNRRISKNFKKFLIPILLILISIFFYALFYMDNFPKQYSYFILGIMALLPMIYFVFSHPKFLGKILVASIYFFFLYFIMELFAVAYDWWIYPGSYVGYLTIFNLTFPFEELFFWMMLYTACLISYYELLIDSHDKTTPN